MAAYMTFKQSCSVFYKHSLNRLYGLMANIFGHPPELFPALSAVNQVPIYIPETDSDKEDGFLWAVPKRRRSLEKRWKRRASHFEALQNKYTKDPMSICDTCGHYHLARTVCGNCYEQVKRETELLRDKIQEKLGLSPVEKEVSIRYANDPPPDAKSSEKSMCVEIEKERPQWFSQGLLLKGNFKKEVPPVIDSDFPAGKK